jgi:hypothetical protein
MENNDLKIRFKNGHNINTFKKSIKEAISKTTEPEKIEEGEISQLKEKTLEEIKMAKELREWVKNTIKIATVNISTHADSKEYGVSLSATELHSESLSEPKFSKVLHEARYPRLKNQLRIHWAWLKKQDYDEVYKFIEVSAELKKAQEDHKRLIKDIFKFLDTLLIVDNPPDYDSVKYQNYRDNILKSITEGK